MQRDWAESVLLITRAVDEGGDGGGRNRTERGRVCVCFKSTYDRRECHAIVRSGHSAQRSADLWLVTGAYYIRRKITRPFVV